MKTKKIPISFNYDNQIKLTELIDLMGISNVYGDIPKAVKFSINFTLSALKNPQKVYTDLEASELATYFQSIRRAEEKRRNKEKAQKLLESDQKV